MFLFKGVPRFFHYDQNTFTGGLCLLKRILALLADGTGYSGELASYLSSKRDFIFKPVLFNNISELRKFVTEYTKRLLNFLWFRTNKLKKYIISSDIVNVRWLDEAKVCWWWVKTKNLKDNFECKNIPWLYFIWECVDVTWKTWWFNLQRCWTSGAICASGINEKGK